MKKFLSISLLLAFASFARAQTVSIDFLLGNLTGADGTSLMKDGMLIQVYSASSLTAFTQPTPTSFSSGGATLLFSGAFDSTNTTGASGSMDIVLSSIPTATLPQGSSFMVQWFPTISAANVGNGPGYDTPYGQYGTLNDQSWVSPAAGSTVQYSLLTMSSGAGTANNLLGAALLKTMAATPVPEPATYAAIFGALALGFVAYRRRQLAV